MPKRSRDREAVSVKISVTFVSAQAGANPILKIDSPNDISDEIDGITYNDFDKLCDELGGYVDDKENGANFHFDTSHNYFIDSRAWEHRTSIYGRKKKDDSSSNSEKVTQNKLIPIRNEDEFRNHIKTIARKVYVEFYQRSTRKKKEKERSLLWFEADLCVVLVKEKVPVTCVEGKTKSTTVSSSVGSDNINSNSVSSITQHYY